MNHRWLRVFAVAPLLALLGAPASSGPVLASSLDYSNMSPIQKKLVSGFVREAMTADQDSSGTQPKNYFPTGSDACPANLSSNIKVNQNCLNISRTAGGGAQTQNETAIAQDPNDPNHILAAWNDYRRGPSNCIGAYSTDKGRTWNDTIPPMAITASSVFGRGSEYWTEAGDPSVAWDSRGNAYYACLMFNRGHPASNNPDQSSGVYVFRSTQNHGASWNYPGRAVVEFGAVAGEAFFGQFLEDKPWMTVDNNTGSPFQDRVYVTWTEFLGDGSAYIWESYSADYGEHFSARHLVSVNSPLCANDYGAGTAQGGCNENQFSQPFVAPDGTLYVVFDNYNSAASKALTPDNRYQVFLAKSQDGGNTFLPPVKVSDYYDLPDCAAYQGGRDAGNACIPEKGAGTRSVFRATNYPVGAVNPLSPNQVVVTFGSYVNQHSNESNGCAPAGFSPFLQPLYTGVKTAGACNDDILISVSNDAGATFTGTTADPRTEPVVTQDPGQATTDQWWQWMAFTKTGKLAVSYYDRQYGDDETSGFSDISLSGSGDVTQFATQRVTSSSNPPPTQFAGTFLGDYSGLSAIDNAYPLWSDTREPALFICPGSATPGNPPAVCNGTAFNGLPANDQDVFTAASSVPSK